MKSKKKAVVKSAPIRETLKDAKLQKAAPATATRAKTKAPAPCVECRVANAFHAWHSQHLTPSFNWAIDFADVITIPAGKRAVIELVTATIQVPSGERARLRLFTSLGSMPSNLDFILTPQGEVNGQDIMVATHSVRVYSDSLIEFNVNRDNAKTEGEALICVSGYLVDV